MSDLSFTEVSEILALIEKTECSQLSLEYGDLRITVDRTASGPGSPSGTSESALRGAGTTGNGSPPVAPGASQAIAAKTGESDVGEETGLLSEAEPAETERNGAAAPPTEANWVPVRSPSLGTFYRSPAPGEPPFVAEGDQVEAGQTVGVVEVMKLFSNVSAEVSGIVASLPVADGQLVEHEQPLVWIEPR